MSPRVGTTGLTRELAVWPLTRAISASLGHSEASSMQLVSRGRNSLPMLVACHRVMSTASEMALTCYWVSVSNEIDYTSKYPDSVPNQEMSMIMNPCPGIVQALPPVTTSDAHSSVPILPGVASFASPWPSGFGHNRFPLTSSKGDSDSVGIRPLP